MIELSNVLKSFGSVVALDAVTLRIAPGERVALVGSNGSGKTTLLRALLGLVRVGGHVRIGGVEVAREPDVALRSVAYMPQIAPPLEAPVDEVVRAWATLRSRSPEAVEARAARLGLPWASVRRTRFRDLSGGMKQKVLAAMALAAESPVLVCDEPTANLDALARSAFFEQVNERPPQSILVLCSHRVDEVRHLVDRVVEMRDGRVLRDGSVTDHFAVARSSRIEVAVRAETTGAAAARAFLAARGFRSDGGDRFTALFTQDEKLEVVLRLLGEHQAAVHDLVVMDAEDVPLAQPARPRHLRAVS